MRTFNDAHREALAAGCPLAKISRRIDKQIERRRVTTVERRLAKAAVSGEHGDVAEAVFEDVPVEVERNVCVRASAIVSVPAGTWRAELLALGWTDVDGDVEVEVSRAPAYDSREAERIEEARAMLTRVGPAPEPAP